MKPWDIIGGMVIALVFGIAFASALTFLAFAVRTFGWRMASRKWRSKAQVGDEVLYLSMNGWVRGKISMKYPDGQVCVKVKTGYGSSSGPNDLDNLFIFVEWVKHEGWAQ